MMYDLNELIIAVRDAIWSFPFLVCIVGAALVTTLALKGVQFRYFVEGWRRVLGKADVETTKVSKGDMTSFQAFLIALNVGLGNGCLAGVATAIHAGGPGAAFWMFCVGILAMAFRFAEVFLSVSFSKLAQAGNKSVLGGPFLYINQLPFGSTLAYVYAVVCLFYGLVSGNIMQTNSMSTALHHATGIPLLTIGICLAAFILYVMLGGAHRIVKVADSIIPFKVILFFGSMVVILGYYWNQLIPALHLIVSSAFSPQAVGGAVVGLTIQHVISIAISRSINGSEAGLGTAAIFYGNTGSSHPFNDGITSMLSTFMSVNVVAMLVSLTLVVSGVWNGDVNGSPMVIQSYETVFGVWGSVIVTLLSLSFGLGVFVPYGYITRQCWLYLTKGRFETFFCFVFAAVGFTGALLSIQLVWNMVEVAVPCLLVINLAAIIYLLPYIRTQLSSMKK